MARRGSSTYPVRRRYRRNRAAKEVLPALQPTRLVVTDIQAQNARDNKAIVWMPMHPLNFLRLTTGSDQALRRFLSAKADHKGQKVDLDIYNRAALEGKIIVPPFLRVRKDTGQVDGHEGRHRASALYRRDRKAGLWVAIIIRKRLRDGSYAAEYYEELKWPKKRFLGPRDVPTTFYGQFRPTVVRVRREAMVPIYTPDGERLV